MRFLNGFILLITLISNFLFSQESYDNCSSALTLCPNDSVVVTNFSATITKCTNCEDDFSNVVCFTAKNTIWLTFKTNLTGGDLQFTIDNISYKSNPNQATVMNAAMIHAALPCDPTTFNLIGNCVSNGSTSMVITATNLPPNTTYYVIISGGQTVGTSLPGEAQMRVFMHGTGVDRPIPTITIIPPKQSICPNETIRIESQLANCKDSVSYSWFINDTLVATTDSSFFETNSLKEGDVVSVSNTCFSDCKVLVSSKTSKFSVLNFLVDAGKDTTIHEGETIILQGISSGDTYFWEPHITDSTNIKPAVSPHYNTTYTLVSNYKGCTISKDVHVKVLKHKFEAVTSFTPNGDGINDTWLVPYLEDYPNCELKIYSRWGQPVYETTGYTYKKAWDGTYNGSVVDEGVYFYIIHLRDSFNNGPIQGTVTVIR